MALERFSFNITGTSPLLMNNPAGMKKPGEDGSTAKVKKIPLPDEEARMLMYRDDKGNAWGPSMGFKSMLMCAAKGRKFGKAFAPAVIKGNVFTPIEAERTTIFHPKTKKPLTEKDYTVDSRRAVLKNGGKKVGVVRSRPRFEQWACRVELDIDTDVLDVSAVLGLFEIAGRNVGYLDFRPENGGPFGRFTVTAAK